MQTIHHSTEITEVTVNQHKKTRHTQLLSIITHNNHMLLYKIEEKKLLCKKRRQINQWLQTNQMTQFLQNNLHHITMQISIIPTKFQDMWINQRVQAAIIRIIIRSLQEATIIAIFNQFYKKHIFINNQTMDMLKSHLQGWIHLILGVPFNNN